MGVTMNVFKRHAVVGAACVFVGLVTACSGGSTAGGQPPSTNGESPSTETEQDSGSSGISNPKDATAVDSCSLLPPEGATSLGLNPAGQERGNVLDPDSPAMCVWENSGGSRSVTLNAFNDRSIETYYQHESEYSDFARLEIAGYPAVRANKGDSVSKGSCGFVVATKDGQVMSGSSIITSNPEQDPCAVAKKALEAAVPALPAAK